MLIAISTVQEIRELRQLILADLPVKLKGSADFFELKILFLGILAQFLAR